MQLWMSFLETSLEESAEPVWPTLDQTQREEIVMALARLIAKTTAVLDVAGVDQEARDD